MTFKYNVARLKCQHEGKVQVLIFQATMMMSEYSHGIEERNTKSAVSLLIKLQFALHGLFYQTKRHEQKI